MSLDKSTNAIVTHGKAARTKSRGCLTLADLAPVSSASAVPGVHPVTLKEIETDAIHQCMKRHKGNRFKAAEELKMSRTTLWRKLRKSPALREWV